MRAIKTCFDWAYDQVERLLIVIVGRLGGGSYNQIQQDLARHDRVVKFYREHPEKCAQAVWEISLAKKLDK
jgi:hypothetical protein